METEKSEADRSLTHQKEILHALRGRLQALELTEAQLGVSTPPEVRVEIRELTERIPLHEVEVARLQSQVAQAHFSLPEVEYRLALSKVWDTPRGFPKFTGIAELELVRLQKGLLPEQAIRIEEEVRQALAEEAFEGVGPQFRIHLPILPYPETIITELQDEAGADKTILVEQKFFVQGAYYYTTIDVEKETKAIYTAIGRAIRLHPKTALNLLVKILPTDILLDVDEFGRLLMNVNRVWNYRGDKIVFEDFMRRLSLEIRRIGL